MNSNLKIDKRIQITTETKNNSQKLFHKDINLGIEILRAYMSFSIVILHFLKKDFLNNIYLKFIFHCQPFYVPTFFVISFYFSFGTLYTKNINKIKDRIIRILIPYIIWPTFLWIINLLYNHDSKINYKTFKPIIFQLLIGYDFYAVFWFQFDLIVITIIMSIIIFIFNDYSLLIFKILLFTFFLLNKQYEKNLEVYKQIGSIKPLLGSFIYSISGFFLGSKFIINKFSSKKYLIIILFIPAIIFIYIYKILLQISIRFKIIVVNFVVICLFIIFSLLPFELIDNFIIKKILKQLTSYTGGIYYIHYLFRNIISRYFKIFNKGDFLSWIINYCLIFLLNYFF